MNFNGSKSRAATAAAVAEPSGLTPEHRTALAEAAAMIGNGQSHEAAVEHLVGHGMPRLVAKVLVKQYDKRPAS